MKRLFVTFMLLVSFSTVIMANVETKELLYWCNPEVRLKGLEAVLIKEVKGETILAVYTESRKWGAVDEHLSSVDFSINQNSQLYTSNNHGVSLRINTEGMTPHLPESVYPAHFTDQRFGFDMDMECEFSR